MDEVKTHVVLFEKRFLDFNKWPEEIPLGTQMRLTKSQYQLLKGSDPDAVTLVEVSTPPEVLERIFAAARAEKAAEILDDELTPYEPGDVPEEVSDLLEHTIPQEIIVDDEDVTWEPVGWYKAQLAKGAKK